MAEGVSFKPRIELVAGSSGSGKSTLIKRTVTRAPRLLVFDACAEYDQAGCHVVRSLPVLARTLLAAGAGPGRYAYVPTDARAEFDAFCRIAWHWPRAVVVVEELAAVTAPGKAPPAWHRLVSQGRKRGFSLIAATQRPAESDKTILGNATAVHVGRLARAADREYMARELDIPPADLAALKPLHLITRNLVNGTTKKTRLSF